MDIEKNRNGWIVRDRCQYSSLHFPPFRDWSTIVPLCVIVCNGEGYQFGTIGTSHHHRRSIHTVLPLKGKEKKKKRIGGEEKRRRCLSMLSQMDSFVKQRLPLYWLVLYRRIDLDSARVCVSKERSLQLGLIALPPVRLPIDPAAAARPA